MDIGKSASEADGGDALLSTNVVGKVQKLKIKKGEDVCGWRCGARHLSCGSLQPFANAKWTLVLFSLSNMLQQVIFNGLIAVTISTLEKRFELRSTESGLIGSMGDLGRGVAMFLIMFLSSRADKPRMIGWGLVVAGISSIMFAMPHFTAPEYVYMSDDIFNYCGNVTDPDCDASSLKNYLYWFTACFCLIGAGSCPLTVYTMTYLDENLRKDDSALYTGIYFAIGGLGPAVGFVLGGMTLEIYTYLFMDQSTLTIDSSSYSWVGAWWLGFLVVGIVTVFIGIPILLLPKYLPGTEKHRCDRDQEAQKSHVKSNEKNENRSGAGRVTSDMLSLFKNKPYIFVTLGDTMNAALVYGFNTFGAKYLETVFGLSPFHSSLLYGIAAIFAAFGAQFSSGVIIKKFKLQVVGMLKFMIVTSVISAICSIGFLVHCDDIEFAGGTVPYVNSSESMSAFSSCNANCNCNTDRYEPVCADDVMYFSPCFAGCQVQVNETSFTHCSCVMSNTSQVDYDAIVSARTCDWKPCNMIIAFIFVVFICFFTSILTMPAARQVTLRCVPFDKRDMAISFQCAIGYLVGTIPGRVLVGLVLDHACRAWSTECGEKGSCKVYNRADIAKNNTILLLAQTISVAILYTLCFFTYKPAGESIINEPALEEIELENFEKNDQM